MMWSRRSAAGAARPKVGVSSRRINSVSSHLLLLESPTSWLDPARVLTPPPWLTFNFNPYHLLLRSILVSPPSSALPHTHDPSRRPPSSTALDRPNSKTITLPPIADPQVDVLYGQGHLLGWSRWRGTRWEGPRRSVWERRQRGDGDPQHCLLERGGRRRGLGRRQSEWRMECGKGMFDCRL